MSDTDTQGGDREWIEYKREKAKVFIDEGYSIGWKPGPDNWMRIYKEQWHEGEQHILEATAKIYPLGSEWGIGGGKVSKLCIRLVKCDLMKEVLSLPSRQISTLFNFDRGDDVNRLSENGEAKRLYDVVVRHLN